jgi:hypothetical protein
MRHFSEWALAAAVLVAAAPPGHAADPNPDARRARGDAKAAAEKAKPKNAPPAAAVPDTSRDVNLKALRLGIEYLDRKSVV